MTTTTVPSLDTGAFATQITSIRELADQAEELRTRREGVLTEMRARALEDDFGDYAQLYGHHYCPKSHIHGPNAEVGDRIHVADLYSAAKPLPSGEILRAVRRAERDTWPVRWPARALSSDLLKVDRGVFEVVLVEATGLGGARVHAVRVTEPDPDEGHAAAVAQLRRMARHDELRIQVRDRDVRVVSPMNEVVHDGTVVSSMAWLMNIDLDMARTDVS